MCERVNVYLITIKVILKINYKIYKILLTSEIANII